MTQINDKLKEALIAAGYSGTNNDMEKAYYTANPKGSYPAYIASLKALGYTGTINDMELAYYVAGLGGGGSDDDFASVTTLLSFEGANGSTTITDNSNTGATWTAGGTSAIDTSQFKFGSSSYSVDGTISDYASTPDATAHELGSGLWTIEGWWRWRSSPSVYQGLIGKWGSGVKSYGILLNGSQNKLQLFLSTNGAASIIKIDQAWTPTLDTWYAIAADFDGTTYRLYVDGAVLGTATTLVALFDAGATLNVGSVDNNDFDGHIDEVRITKGVARYAGAYTPATSAFPTS